jgi:hypothetical protein
VETRFARERPAAEAALGELRQLAELEGVALHFLNGNHDPAISEISHVDLRGGEILVTHGDMLFHDISPWSPEAEFLGACHSRALAGFNGDSLVDFEKRLAASKHPSLSLELHVAERSRGPMSGVRLLLREAWPPRRPFRILRCWMETPAKAAELASLFRPRARYVIVGHTHLAGIWKRAGRIIINTGSFLPFFGRTAVDVSEGRLVVRAVARQRGSFHPARPLAGHILETSGFPG